MNEIQIFNNADFGEVRVIELNGEPWFVLKDVCAAFGEQNYRRVSQRLEEEEKGVSQIATPGGLQEMTVVNESGLYSTLFYMQPEKARGVSEEYIEKRKAQLSKFKHWVTHDVLPSIRKHGGYLTPQKIDEILSNPDTIIRLATNLKEERAKRKEAERINAENKPKVEFFDTVAESKTAIEMKEAANALNFKKVGRNKLFQLLRERGILTSKNQPYQKYVDCGYFRTIEQKWQTPDGDTNISIKTLVYQKGLDFIRKTLLKLGYRQLETEIA